MHDINSLVERYQKGDNTAAEELIEAFTPLFYKYLRILSNEEIDLTDPNSAKFASLFISNKTVRKDLLRGKHSNEVKTAVMQAMSIVHHLSSGLTLEDLQQEMIAILLECARRYKKEVNESFSAYFNIVLCYKLRNFIINYISDPACAPLDLETVENLIFEEKPTDNLYTADWVSGLTASPPFDELTPVDRVLVLKKFEEGKTLKQVGREMGYSKSGLWKRLRKIKEKVKAAHLAREV